MYLLDTNACIRILNGSSPTLIRRFKERQARDILMCSIVKAELVFGAYNSSRAGNNLRLLEKFFSPYRTVPFNDDCIDSYGRIRADLRHSGQPIGANDLLIASIAVANDLTVVTANSREFGKVSHLRFENWEA